MTNADGDAVTVLMDADFEVTSIKQGRDCDGRGHDGGSDSGTTESSATESNAT